MSQLATRASQPAEGWNRFLACISNPENDSLDLLPIADSFRPKSSWDERTDLQRATYRGNRSANHLLNFPIRALGPVVLAPVGAIKRSVARPCSLGAVAAAAPMTGLALVGGVLIGATAGVVEGAMTVGDGLLAAYWVSHYGATFTCASLHRASAAVVHAVADAWHGVTAALAPRDQN